MKLQNNCTPEENVDIRKYTIGTVLTFRQYNGDEVGTLGEDHSYTFRRGDKLVVTINNACGMGVDVKRISDGRIDMVWPEEVVVSRRQEIPKGFDLSSPDEIFPDLEQVHVA